MTTPFTLGVTGKVFILAYKIDLSEFNMFTEPVCSNSATPANFKREILGLLERDMKTLGNQEAAVKNLDSAINKHGIDSTEARTILLESPIHDAWNDQLQVSRPKQLAKIIQPHVKGRLLDFLSGDGRLARKLVEVGCDNILATERVDDYPEIIQTNGVQFVPYAEFFSHPDSHSCGTILMSAVLHHEEDAIKTLDKLCGINAQRWIVLENCLSQDYNLDFHLFMDVFFNRCLNRFELNCTESHLFFEEWKRVFEKYGEVTFTIESIAVPGIPFPYSLFIVDFPNK